MPFTRLHVPESLPVETCHSANAALHEALVSTCGVHEDDDFCLVLRYRAGDMILHPTFMGSRDPKQTVVFEVTLLGGRTDEQKEAFYREFRVRLNAIGMNPDDSIVFLVENAPIDFSFSSQGSVKTALGL